MVFKDDKKHRMFYLNFYPWVLALKLFETMSYDIVGENLIFLDQNSY